MRHWMNLFESNGQGIEIGDLSADIKQDLLDMLLGPNSPTAFVKYWMDHHGASSYRDSYVAQDIFGTEHLNERGFDDFIMVERLALDPREINNNDRSTSDAVVVKYTAMHPSTSPPILVRQTPEGWLIVEGGHRLAAAKARGDESITVFDVTIFFDKSEDDWSHLLG